MKKIWGFLFLTTFFLLAGQASAEEVADFSQEIVIDKSGGLTINEIVTYDFFEASKHGIYRDIPYKYEARGGNYNLRLTVNSITDENGLPYNYQVLGQGDAKRIKIGDEEEFVTGRKIYAIQYEIKRAINFFDDADELYWNVTGDQWPVPIVQSKSTIIFPEPVAETGLQATCYTGPLGSTAECVSTRFVYEGAGLVKQAVFIDDVIQPGSNFTFALSFPKGTILEPTFLAKLLDILKDNFILGLPFLVFIGFYYFWYKHGRDLGGRGTIVAQFDAPDGLSPMGVGTLIDERADNKDFSANIVNLAVKGYLKIVQLETGFIFKKPDYVFVALPGGEKISRSEKEIFDAIFLEGHLETDMEKIAEIKNIAKLDKIDKAVYLSDLKNIFYKHLESIKVNIYKELTERDYFQKNPRNLRILYTVIGAITMFLSIYAGAFMGFLATISLALSGLIIIIFAQIIPAKTAKGTLAKEHILGLKRYLQVAEKDRLEFHQAPAKNPEIFEKLLPFAMVLGVEKEWAKQFEDIYQGVRPSWYAGGPDRMFSALTLTNSLNAFSASASTSAASSPSSASSGGSGFSGGGSGGGFGGGGGGSW
jgi:uncharacterized membrane protein